MAHLAERESDVRCRKLP